MQTDQLPVYPSNIQGELRLILQNKDLFLLCYKYLEDYRRLNEEQNRIITKDFIESQIRIGDEEIEELQLELKGAEQKLSVRQHHNETLIGQLAVRGMSNLGESLLKRNICRSPVLRKCPSLAPHSDMKNKDLSLFENIALAIEEIQREIKNKLKPLCEFYRDLFYLQLHFTLVLTQVCNYCMPLVTENVGLIDRVFFWADRPEFELIKKSGEIADRLKDIYTRTQSVLTLLVENVMFLQNKVELQRNLERKFQERLEVQQLEKDKVLRRIHGSRLDMDLLEEENDRLVGIIVKLDPKFVRTDHFTELADYSVRRNYLEGRLTPSGYQAHQGNSTPPPKPNSNQNLRSFNIDSHSTVTSELSSNPNKNVSNIDQDDKKKSKRKITKHKSKKKPKGTNEENIDVNKQISVENKEIVKSTDDNNINDSNKNYCKSSIKDLFLSKTKSIFDQAFRKSLSPKPSNNYVKIFEGEILAELSQFSPANESPDSKPLDFEHTNNSWDFSIERSLKRKYDLKESELHQKKPSKIKQHHHHHHQHHRKKDTNQSRDL